MRTLCYRMDEAGKLGSKAKQPQHYAGLLLPWSSFTVCTSLFIVSWSAEAWTLNVKMLNLK